MRILLIDNYDPFTFNLYRYIAEIAGSPPIVIRNDQYTWDKVEPLAFDAIVISPGPGSSTQKFHPGISASALQQTQRPVLGVCMGRQLLGRVLGLAVEHAALGRSTVLRTFHNDSALFAGLESPFEAFRYNALEIREPLPAGLEKMAWSEDGAVMALEVVGLPIWCIQFHPESVYTDSGTTLLRRFIDLTASFHIRDGLPPAGGQQAAQRPQNSPEPNWIMELVASSVDPERVYSRLFGEQKNAFWLDSSLVAPELSRFSVMGCASGLHDKIILFNSRTKQVTHGADGTAIQHTDIFGVLDTEFSGAQSIQGPMPIAFIGGFIAYFNHAPGDLSWVNDPGGTQPDAAIIKAARCVIIDHVSNELYVVAQYLSADEKAQAERWVEMTSAEIYRLGDDGFFDGIGETRAAYSIGKHELLALLQAAWRDQYVNLLVFDFSVVRGDRRADN